MPKLKLKMKYLHLIYVLVLGIIFFNPYSISKYGLIFLLIVIFFKILNMRNLNYILNCTQFWALFFFCILYTIFQFFYQFITIKTCITYLTYPLILYIFGLLIINKIKNEIQLIDYLYAVILGFSLLGIYTVYHSVPIFGMPNSLNIRYGTILWAEDLALSATVVGIYLSLGIALIGLLFVKTDIYSKAINTVISLLSLYSSILLANRTGLIIAFLSIIGIYVIQLKLSTITKKIKITLFLLFEFLVLVCLYNMNIFNIKTFWLESNAFYRFTNMSLINDPRLTAWIESLTGIFIKPLGGKQAQLSLNYAHNLWLDVGWTTGLLPFLTLVIFTLMTLKDYIKMLRNIKISLYLKCFISSMLIAFLFIFMVEPVIEANILFFCAFCFLSGILRSINKNVNVCLDKNDVNKENYENSLAD